MGALLYELEHQGLRVLLSMTQAGFGRAVKKIRGIFQRDISLNGVIIFMKNCCNGGTSLGPQDPFLFKFILC